GLSITAGICEELLFRGLLPALLAALLHEPSPWLVILLAAAAFGAAHAYQGVTGVVVTAILGAVLGFIYLGTGSLFLVMVLHALIDARVGLLPARALGVTPIGVPA
ncbi:MAG: CPBP family intramembrane metalloprotease, partial [Candidatus Dormibacteraeota bacterium]|nr:CPBP family intramembrane metalloprotease [Candidatus Dormibacteraeota bacterium]